MDSTESPDKSFDELQDSLLFFRFPASAFAPLQSVLYESATDPYETEITQGHFMVQNPLMPPHYPE